MADGRRESRLQGLRENGEGRHQECLHSQGPVRTGSRKAVPEPARLRRRRRCRPGRQGLAATQFYHLSLGLSPCRRRSEAGAGRVRTHGADFMDQRPCRHSRPVRRQQCLWRRWPVVRDHAGSRAERLRRLDGRPDQGARRRSRLLGHRRAVDRRAAMADRRPAPSRDPGSHAEEIRLRPARHRRWPDQIRNLRRQQCAALRYPAEARDA